MLRMLLFLILPWKCSSFADSIMSSFLNLTPCSAKTDMFCLTSTLVNCFSFQTFIFVKWINLIFRKFPDNCFWGFSFESGLLDISFACWSGLSRILMPSYTAMCLQTTCWSSSFARYFYHAKESYANFRMGKWISSFVVKTLFVLTFVVTNGIVS